MRPDDGSPLVKASPDWAGQYKYNGSHGTLIKKDRRAGLMGRSWKNNFLRKQGEITSDIWLLPWRDCVLQGELTFFDDSGDDVFLTALATEKKKREYGVRPIFMVFDVLEVDGRDFKGESFRVRDRWLRDNLPELDHIKKVTTFYERTGKDWLWENSREGIVLKYVHSTISDGRSSGWVKAKNWTSDDFWVVGMTVGGGKNKPTFRALLLVDDENRYVGNVGGGFSDAERVSIKKALPPCSRENMPIIFNRENLPNNILYFTPKRMLVEVEYTSWSRNGLMNNPKFLKKRDDLL
jgi:ATP-dependent DNA ligase